MWSMRPRTSPSGIFASNFSGTGSTGCGDAGPTAFDSATMPAPIAVAIRMQPAENSARPPVKKHPARSAFADIVIETGAPQRLIRRLIPEMLVRF